MRFDLAAIRSLTRFGIGASSNQMSEIEGLPSLPLASLAAPASLGCGSNFDAAVLRDVAVIYPVARS